MPERVAREAVRSGMLGPPLYTFALPWITWMVFAAAPLFFFFHSLRKPEAGSPSARRVGASR